MINLDLALKVKLDPAASCRLKSIIDTMLERDVVDVRHEIALLDAIFNPKEGV